MKLVVYGADWCVFCKKAKSLLEKYGIEYEYKNIDIMGNLNDLVSITGSRPKSIPLIFDEYDDLIGGYSDLLVYLDE